METVATIVANIVFIMLSSKLISFSLISLLVVLFGLKLWKRIYGIESNCSCGYKKQEKLM